MHVTFCTQKYNFDKITAILTLTGEGTKGKDWLRARGHHLCLIDTIFYFFWGGGAQGNMTIYFTGTLGSNSLFLENKTNVRECLKISLRKKADHKISLLYPFLPTYIPPI